jgi:hypothetical protein
VISKIMLHIQFSDPFSSEVKRRLQQQIPVASASSHTTVAEGKSATKNIGNFMILFQS